MNYATFLALIAAMGLLMGCGEAPRITTMSVNPPCYVRETSHTFPELYCNGKLTKTIPHEAFEAQK